MEKSNNNEINNNNKSKSPENKVNNDIPTKDRSQEPRRKTRLSTAIDSLNPKPKKEKPLFFVNILIREKKYRQYCGDGLQKIRWLTDCAIYKYENETKKTNLGIAYGLKNENGNLCDLNSRIIDNLENGANVLVLLKEEYESEMRERKKTGGKGNTNLTDDFLRQLKQFNNGYKFEYEDENEGDEFVDQEENDNEEDINDDQTLQKEMSQKGNKSQSKSLNNDNEGELNLNDVDDAEENINENENNINNNIKGSEGEEYTIDSNIKIFKGKYLNGKKNGKGKEYNYEGNLIFEGEYLNNQEYKGKK